MRHFRFLFQRLSSKRGHILVRGLCVLGVLTSVFALCSMGEGFRVTHVGRVAGNLEVQFESDVTNYYELHAGNEVTAINRPVAIEFGQAGTGSLVDALGAIRTIDIRSGASGYWNCPFSTSYYHARTQVIYLGREIGGPVDIGSIAFNFLWLPPQQAMENLTIRMKHTALSRYTAPTWEGTGWQTLFQQDTGVSRTGWVDFVFQDVFSFNSLSNLLIDISFDNGLSSYGDGYVESFDAHASRSAYRGVYGYDGYDNPLAWTGSTPGPYVSTQVPVIRLGLRSTSRQFYRVVRLPRSAPIDTDGDGIDDVYELNRNFLDPLNGGDGALDHDGDGVSTFVEYICHTDPGNPGDFPDLSLDSDGDGVGDVYEYMHGKNPTNVASVPAPTLYVDAAAASGGDGSASRPFSTIGSALGVAEAYDIIQVADGVYTGTANKNLSFQGLPLMLISEHGPENCVIDCQGRGRGFTFQDGEDGCAVLRGFTIRNGNSRYDGNGGGAIYCASSSPRIERCRLLGNTTGYGGGAIYIAYSASPVLENCILAGNTASYGGGLYNYGASPFLCNCTITDNSADWGGGGIYTAYSVPIIKNCIVWGNGADPIYDDWDSSVVNYSVVEGGWPGQGNFDANPRLTGQYRLKAESPCIDAGSTNAPTRDIDGEARWNDPAHSNVVSIVDIGADEFVDTDHDGLADGWERQYFGNLAHNGTVDGDSDGLNDRAEYEEGTNPGSADTDGDGLSDGVEVNTYRTSPSNPDSDGDGMPDGWEVAFGFNPLDSSDAVDDPDGDGCGNVYEYMHGKNPTNAASVPAPTLYVDAAVVSGGDGSESSPFSTIGAALGAAAVYDIIQVADGVYTGAPNKNLSFQGLPLMLISEHGPENCIIDCQGNGRGITFQNGEDGCAVLRGFAIRNGNTGYDGNGGGAIYCSYASPRIERCRLEGNMAEGSSGGAIYIGSLASPVLENCTLVGNSAYSGGGLYNQNASPKVVNCTIVNNSASSSGGGIYNDNGNLSFRNSILWENSPDQIGGNPSLVTFCDIQGGLAGEGNLNTNPQLTVTYRLKADSPCVDAGSASNAPLRDIDGEARWDDPAHSNVVSMVDMGADEFVDSDGDGMSDQWEREHFGNLGRNGLGDNDADGLTDRAEYEQGTDPGVGDTDGDGLTDGAEVHTYGTSPIKVDTDGDEMPDGWEVGYGLNPVSATDQMGDSDGDGYGNVYEYMQGKNPTNAASAPVTTLYVDAAASAAGTGSVSSAFNTLSAGLSAAPRYAIIQVADGVYTGAPNKDLSFQGKPLMLLSTNGPERCVIDCQGSGRGFTFQNAEDGRSVLRGFTIRNGNSGWDNGGAIYCSSSSPRIEGCRLIGNSAAGYSGGAIYTSSGSPVLENCILAGNSAYYGGAMYNYGNPRLRNCTIVNNTASSSGGGIYNSSGNPSLVNCIVWGNSPNQTYGGTPLATFCDIQGGLAGEGNLNTNPQFTVTYRLKAGSPCIDAGSASNAPLRDLDGEARWDDPAHSNVVSMVDMGADEFVDGDGDGMSDQWEREHFGNLGRNGLGDNDADGLTDREEFEQGTDPGVGDTDGDGVTDGAEVNTYGTNPLKVDTDGDEMPDGWEVGCGLNPVSATDQMGDPDGDGCGNVYEYMQGKNPTNAASSPVPTLYVDAAASAGGTGSVSSAFNTLSAGLSAASRYAIIQVADGVYTGAPNKNLSFQGKPLMLLSTNGPERCVIDCQGSGRGFTFQNAEDARSVLRGFTIRNGNGYGGAIYCSSASPRIEGCRLIGNSAAGNYGGAIYNNSASPVIESCLIAQNTASSGGGLYNGSSSPRLRNCTIVNNTASSSGGGIYNSSGNPSLVNCIVWGNSPNQTYGGTPLVTFCDIQGGLAGEGNINTNPQLTVTYRLKADSPCIDAGSASNAPLRDLDGELRWDDPAHSNVVSMVDMGADEFVDSDGDGMSDQWEREHFGNLGRDGLADYEGDGLNDRGEYEQGTDPGVKDSDGDGLWDGAEVNTYGTNPLKVDTDGDEMPDGWEVGYGFNPVSATDQMGDPDGDGYGNVYEYMQGKNPTNAASSPVPTLYVDAAASAGGTGSVSSAFNTLSAGLSAAPRYAIIQVADGVYTGAPNKNLSFQGKPLMLLSTNGPERCVIDCQGSGRGFTFQNAEDGRSVLRGFTIRNGNGSGGAIYCSSASPRIEGCRLIGNSAAGNYGGAIYNNSANPVIESCLIAQNTASSGGGLYNGSSSPRLRNCTIVNNTASSSGGGIYNDGGNPSLVNCIVWGNSPNQTYGGTPLVTFCDIQGGFTNSTTWGYPLAASYHIARTQVIYPASEIGSAGTIQSVAMDVRGVPGQVLNNFTIRLKHTALSEYTVPAWEGSDWAVAYQSNVTISVTGTTTFVLQTPFAFDGSHNLFVDLSFSNSSYSSGGLVLAYPTGKTRSLYNATYSWNGYGDPLSWNGSTPSCSTYSFVPVLSLTMDGSPRVVPNVTEANFSTNPQLTVTYRLKADSPCIDAGSSNAPLRDIDGEARWDDPAHSNVVSMADMGADEFVDTDGDGLPDAWERAKFGNLSHGGTVDEDGDGLTNLQEYGYNTDPTKDDTDGDGLTDEAEVLTYGTDPLNSNMDGDNLNDGQEIAIGSDPRDPYDIKITNPHVTPVFFDPATNQTTLSFGLNWTSDVSVVIKPVQTAAGLLGDVTVTFITNVVRSFTGRFSPGANTIVWDGRDTEGAVVSNRLYVYTIEANSPLGLAAVPYAPTYVSGPVTVTGTSLGTNLNFQGNENLAVNYSLYAPAFVVLAVPYRPYPILWGDPRDAGLNTEYWNGRSSMDGTLLYGNFNVGIKTAVIPENAMVVKHPAGQIIGDLQSEAYLITPTYAEISEIHYSLNRGAVVEIRIRAPNGDTITVLESTTVAAGSHTLEWTGHNDLGRTVGLEGDYDVQLLVEDVASGVSETRTANVTVRLWKDAP